MDGRTKTFSLPITHGLIFESSQKNYVILIGSLPSFLYIFGLIALVPIVKKDIAFSAFIKASGFLSLGALVYEFEQVFTARVFDFYDVIATVLAWLLMLGIHRIEKPHT